MKRVLTTMVALVSAGCEVTVAEPGVDPGSASEASFVPPAEWRGERTFYVDGCESTINERGELAPLPPGSSPCDLCDVTYEIELQSTDACGLRFNNPSYRGLRTRADGTTEVLILGSQDGSPDFNAIASGEAEADERGKNYEYSYEGGFYGHPYRATGTFRAE